MHPEYSTGQMLRTGREQTLAGCERNGRAGLRGGNGTGNRGVKGEIGGVEGRDADRDQAIGGQGLVEFHGEEVGGEGTGPGHGTAEGGDGGRRVEGDRRKRAAKETAAMGEALFLGELAEGGHALADDRGGHRICGVEGPAARAGARREREEMEITEGQTADESEGFVELVVGFAGESGHHIRAECEIRACGGENVGGLLLVVPGAVTPVHAAKNRVRAGLKREMRVRADSAVAGEIAQDGKQIGVPVHGFNGAEAKARKRCLFEDEADERCQRGTRQHRRGREVAAPAAEVDAGKDELLAAVGDELKDAREDSGGRQAARPTAGLRNDAEGAAIRAALLDFEIGPGLRAGYEAGFFKEGVGEGVVGKDGNVIGGSKERMERDERGIGYGGFGGVRGASRFRLHKGESHFGREGLVAVADDGGNAGDCCQLLRRALGVTAGDEDARGGIAAACAADEGAGGAIGFRGDRAGVDDDHIGFSELACAASGGAEAFGDGFPVGAGGAAAEVLDVEGCGHGFSVRGNAGA